MDISNEDTKEPNFGA